MKLKPRNHKKKQSVRKCKTNLQNRLLFTYWRNECWQGMVTHKAIYAHPKQLRELGDIGRRGVTLVLPFRQENYGPRDHGAHCCKASMHWLLGRLNTYTVSFIQFYWMCGCMHIFEVYTGWKSLSSLICFNFRGKLFIHTYRHLY